MSFRVARRAQASWQGTLPDGSGLLTDAGHPALELHTTAEVTLAAVGTISRALGGTEITLEAGLAAG